MKDDIEKLQDDTVQISFDEEHEEQEKHDASKDKFQSQCKCKTLSAILTKHELIDFIPEDKDSTFEAVKRLARILPDMQALTTLVRLGEGFLSRRQCSRVDGGNQRPLTKHAEMLSQLARAQRSFAIAGGRQSRATAWRSFSKLVAEDSQKEVAKTFGSPDGIDKENAAVEVVDFVPSFTMSSGVDEQRRRYQILAIRMHHLAKKVDLVITEQIWRGSHKKGGRSHGSKPFEGSLKSEWVAAVHVVMLEHRGSRLFKCTARSRALVLDPHSLQETDPLVLFEIPPAHLVFHETDVHLLVELSEEAMVAVSWLILVALYCNFCISSPFCNTIV